MLEQEDFYIENGQYVFTEKYHLKRGSCCNSGCRHCPYKKNSSEVSSNLTTDSKLNSDNQTESLIIQLMN